MPPHFPDSPHNLVTTGDNRDAVGTLRRGSGTLVSLWPNCPNEEMIYSPGTLLTECFYCLLFKGTINSLVQFLELRLYGTKS